MTDKAVLVWQARLADAIGRELANANESDAAPALAAYRSIRVTGYTDLMWGQVQRLKSLAPSVH